MPTVNEAPATPTNNPNTKNCQYCVAEPINHKGVNTVNSKIR
jgi:hypothetical protein